MRHASSSPHRVRIRRSAVPLAALALATATLTACGGDSGSTAKPPADADVVVHGQRGLKFDAKTYSAKAGDVKIALVDDDTINHTLLVKGTDFKLVAKRKGAVDSATITLPAGEYTLFCDVPGHGGMKATLVVS